MKTWHGIMKILEVKHLSSDGKAIYEEQNIKNMIHKVGEEYLLKVLFSSTVKPQNYYVGLDNRIALEKNHQIFDAGLYEPTSNGYERQAVDSSSFQVQEITGTIQARTPTLAFRATSGSWTVKNIFIATALLSNNANSVLISSASLSREITVSSGEIVTMRMAMALSDC